VVGVRKGVRGPIVTVSRTHPGLVKRLFELEVPEIADASVEIAAIAREAGHRTKIAVRSHKPGLGAKGACIGPMGARVRAVMAELHGEKIDIVDFSEEPAEFVGHALSPARVSSVTVVDAEARAARVVVPDYQLSLAIGREGQNARLAARLTGWRIDIKSESQLSEEEAGYQGEEWAEGEWVTNAETGEMEWRPAEGGEALTAEAYAQAPETAEPADPTRDAFDADAEVGGTDTATTEADAEPEAPVVEDAAPAPTEEPES
jgi:N utilization substance protein A